MKFKWATVTAVGPIRVTLDGDSSALPFTPDSLVDPLALAVNDRVRCELAGRRIIIHGRAQDTTTATWKTYTPSLSGITLVNGTLAGRYRRVGKSIRFEVAYTVGSSDTFSGTFTFGIPVSARSGYTAGQPWGSAFMLDSSVGTGSRRSGTVLCATLTTCFVLVDSLSSAATATATVPWTWATSDQLYISGEYEAA